MLGDLIIPVDSLSINWGMGLSITLKAGVKFALVAVGSHGSVARTPVAKAGGPGFDSRWLPWVFSSSSWLTNVDGMQDLWCSSRVRLLSTQI